MNVVVYSHSRTFPKKRSEAIRYVTPLLLAGAVKRLRESRHLPAITFEAADLPEDVVALVDAHLLDLGGTYGRPEAGDPIQYDHLLIEHDQGAVEIVVYNRAILLFTAESEAVRRIHQVCSQ